MIQSLLELVTFMKCSVQQKQKTQPSPEKLPDSSEYSQIEIQSESDLNPVESHIVSSSCYSEVSDSEVEISCSSADQSEDINADHSA